MKKSVTAVAAVLLALGAGNAAAATYTFGSLLSGEGAPDVASFATLTATVVGNDVEFTLDVFGLDLFSGASPFVGTIAVDGVRTGSVDAVSGGASSVALHSGGGPGGIYDFRFQIGGGAANRLADGESLSWTWVGGAGQYSSFALHVQGIDYGATDSAWYTSPVPEPATWATLIAGLALAGGAALRRQRSRG
jgi:hypothetical protein